MPIPELVTLADDYDMWRHVSNGRAANQYHQALYYGPQDLEHFLVNGGTEVMIDMGNRLLNKQYKMWSSMCNDMAFPATIDGKLVIAANFRCNSDFFKEYPEHEGVHGYFTFIRLGTGQYRCSMYQTRNNQRNLLEHFGHLGFRGHPGACGIVTDLAIVREAGKDPRIELGDANMIGEGNGEKIQKPEK